jgi:hypothetical protein
MMLSEVQFPQGVGIEGIELPAVHVPLMNLAL